MKVEVEVWESSHQRKEKHYFLRDGQQHAYQSDGAYLVGINPLRVTPEQERQILAILGYALETVGC